jgi:predicted ATP-dependent endonuclease of OLD family
LLIESVTLSNFRCFGPEPTTISLGDMVSFVGHNGSGKSTVLESIVKLFGVSRTDRALKPTDFHVPKGQKLEDQENRTLFIEAKFTFPELSDTVTGTSCLAIPEFFNQMTVGEPGSAPYCRIRLEGAWSQGNTAEGDIEQKLYWITTNDEEDEKSKISVTASQRSQIHVYYVPAIRDPISQIKYVTGSIMYRLIRAIKWSDEFKENHEGLVEEFKTAFQSEAGIDTIQSSISKLWKELSGSELYRDILISPLNNEFKKVVSRLEVILSPSPDGGEEDISRLSEGLRSLFYLSLIQSAFHIEEAVIKDDAESKGFASEHIKPPYLTIFAIEEPENHLAPHYLGRITAIFRDLSSNRRAQVMISSHSSSILKRIYPEEIRHLRLNTKSEAVVSEIILPEQTDEAYKYVRNAVQAFPELYFSKKVILCEGDSEEIILPRIFEAYGLSTDMNFISIVPLGGRHVNHFWRLLNQLGTPYITLLDYDRGRETGGWARIKYVYQQLLEEGVSRESLFTLEDKSILSEEQFNNMHNWEPNAKLENGWRNPLKNFGVFFSCPLDFDFMMLKVFPDIYKRPCEGGVGPAIPDDLSQDGYKLLRNAYASVLKKNPDDITRDMSKVQHPDLYFWYRYLFLGRSKPVSHFRMIVDAEQQNIIERCPEVLKDIITKIQVDQ